jgi:hypothetical protein
MKESREEKILNLLITQELQLAELYELMAEQHPEHRELLMKMCREEREQASWIEHMTMHSVSGRLQFDDVATKAAALQSFNTCLAELVSLLRGGTMPFGRALRLAMDSERAMIDSRVFEHCRTVSGDLKRMFLDMKENASDHVVRLRTLWIQNNSVASTMAYAK